MHIYITNLTAIFTMRRYASGVYAVVLCMPVGPSVCHNPVFYQNG